MKNIWYFNYWLKYLKKSEGEQETGVYVRSDKNVPPPVRKFCLEFVRWVRKNFYFPIRVTIYIKDSYRIKAKDGELVVGTFWRPDTYGMPAYIRIATGDYYELTEQKNAEQAMWLILSTLAHELTHYFQYINRLSLSETTEEHQAEIYSNHILQQYDKYIYESQLYGKHYNVWLMSNIKKNRTLSQTKTGIEISFDKEINMNIREKCMEFVKWLRQEYFFPIRVKVHIKATRYLLRDPKKEKSIVRHRINDKSSKVCDISIAIEEEQLQEIFYHIAYSLTFYFQWINDVQLTLIGKKRQAIKCAKDVLDAYYS